jgi:hypothetical protein
MRRNFGQKNGNVLCQGKVIHAKEARGEEPSGLAASILDYRSCTS